MFSITYRLGDFEVALSADTIEGVLALDDAYNADDDDGWITWEGGECPVAGDTRVEYRLRGGGEYTREAHHLAWKHVGIINDIVAYKVIKNA